MAAGSGGSCSALAHMSTPSASRVLQIAFLGLETLFVGSFVCALILAHDWYRNGFAAGRVLTVLLVASAVPLALVSFLLRHAHWRLAVIGGCTVLAVVLYVGFTPSLWLDGWAKQYTVEVADTTTPSTLTLTAPSGQAGRGLSLSIRGRIDGAARIWYGGSITNVIAGRVDMKYSDNYSTNLLLHYSPDGVRSGHVTIKYAFH